MKNFLLLLFALAIIVVFGGSAFFFWDVSKGARFERRDQPDTESSSKPAIADPPPKEKISFRDAGAGAKSYRP